MHFQDIILTCSEQKASFGVFQHVPTKPDYVPADLVGSGAKIAVGKDGAKQQFKVLKGKAEVVLFTYRPTWHYRQYVAKERRYVTRSLETTDLEQSREDANELFYAL